LDQTSNADQFFIGGPYLVTSGSVDVVGLVLSAVDSRRSSSDTLWDTISSSTSITNFSGTISTFEDLKTAIGNTSIKSGGASTETSLTPEDLGEYLQSVYADESEYSDV